jgi:hypothetical protein
MFLMDLVQSSQIHLDEWQNRSLYPKFRSWFVQLFSRWL